MSPKDRELRSTLNPLNAAVSDAVEPWSKPLVRAVDPTPEVLEEEEPEDEDEDEEKEEAGKGRAKGRKIPKHRCGTRRNPYPRDDGGGHITYVTKVGFSFTVEFDRELRLFAAALPPGVTKSAWAERALRKAMKAHNRTRMLPPASSEEIPRKTDAAKSGGVAGGSSAE